RHTRCLSDWSSDVCSSDLRLSHGRAVRSVGAPRGHDRPKGEVSLKVSTWNVNGIRARYAQVLEWVQREAPDVLCLQEIKSPPDRSEERRVGKEWRSRGGSA